MIKRAAIAMIIVSCCCVPCWSTDYNVGAYYYAWYGTNFHGVDQNLRWHLVPQQQPALGWYSDHDASVISQHFLWARSAGIDFFVLSYWGPQDTTVDWTIRNCLFTNPDIGNLKLAVFLEPAITVSNVGSETSYLCRNYFNQPSYYRIDGKPVIYVYLTRTMSTSTLTTYMDTIRTTARDEGIGEVYIVGDEVFGSPSSSNTTRISKMDAITCYDTYGQLKNFGAGLYVTSSMLDAYKSWNDAWKSLANSAGADFIPNVAPGFNDTGVRSGHSPMSRRLNSEAGASGSLFSGLLDKAKLSLDRDTIVVTSWNEWHEDTQIEPVAVADPTNVVDGTGGAATSGLYYEGYGTLYLDILRSSTSDVPIAPSYPAVSGVTSSALRFSWQDNSGNETGFKVYYNSGIYSPVTLQATTQANATYYDVTGLLSDCYYSFQVLATNGGTDSLRTPNVSVCTLASSPSVGHNVICDKSVGSPYPVGTAFGFTNPAGFDTYGTFRVSCFRYAWDTDPAHVWTDNENTWASGSLTSEANTDGDYYLHLRSYNTVGVPGATDLDYGPFIVSSSDMSIPEVKNATAGSRVRLTSKVLYWKSGNIGYIEEPDRISGIRIQSTETLPSEGTVNLTGTLQRPIGSECYILVDSITRSGAGSVAPLGANNTSMHNALLNGLYVKTWGIVMPGSVTSGSALITDGSGDSGIRLVGSVGTLSEGQFVAVSGALGFDGAPVLYVMEITQ